MSKLIALIDSPIFWETTEPETIVSECMRFFSKTKEEKIKANGGCDCSADSRCEYPYPYEHTNEPKDCPWFVNKKEAAMMAGRLEKEYFRALLTIDPDKAGGVSLDFVSKEECTPLALLEKPQADVVIRLRNCSVYLQYKADEENQYQKWAIAQESMLLDMFKNEQHECIEEDYESHTDPMSMEESYCTFLDRDTKWWNRSIRVLEELHGDEVWYEEHLMLMDKRMEAIRELSAQMKLKVVRFKVKSESSEKLFWGQAEAPF
tara:strand:- start:66249 stop:67034 length:786 start_codon:yes stop_codon:yes gene_type:complete